MIDLSKLLILLQDPTMVVKHEVHGYEEFKKLISELEALEKKSAIHILFIGDKEDSGDSWCPYCKIAEPVIDDSLDAASESSHFIVASIGNKKKWRDIDCPFRKDPDTFLVMVPTLIRWKSPQRLEGTKCSNRDLVIFLLSEPNEGDDDLKEGDDVTEKELKDHDKEADDMTEKEQDKGANHDVISEEQDKGASNDVISEEQDKEIDDMNTKEQDKGAMISKEWKEQDKETNDKVISKEQDKGTDNEDNKN